MGLLALFGARAGQEVVNGVLVLSVVAVPAIAQRGIIITTTTLLLLLPMTLIIRTIMMITVIIILGQELEMGRRIRRKPTGSILVSMRRLIPRNPVTIKMATITTYLILGLSVRARRRRPRKMRSSWNHLSPRKILNPNTNPMMQASGIHGIQRNMPPSKRRQRNQNSTSGHPYQGKLTRRKRKGKP